MKDEITKNSKAKKCVKILLVVAVIIVFNELLKFCFEPYGTASQIMWNDYHKEENLNQIFVGSSICYVGINPYIVDDIMGTDSFNMGTSAQQLAQTKLAIKTAINDHEIKRVVMALGYFSLTGERSTKAEVAFLRAKVNSASFLTKFQTYIKYAFDDDVIGNPESINYLFPWVYNSVSLKKVPSNVTAKLEGKVATEQEMIDNVYRHYVGKGYGYLSGYLNFDDTGNDTTYRYYSETFSEDSLQELRDIACMCKDAGVELVVVATPRPAFDILSYGTNGDEYFEKMLLLQSLFSEYGASYYDFSLAKDELFTNSDKYYFDHEHMNKEGSEAFSTSMANFLLKKDAGTDVDSLFYTPEEYLNSIDYISTVWFKTKCEGNSICVTPISYKGTNVEVEYQYTVYNETTGQLDVIKDYSTDTSAVIPLNSDGNDNGCIKIIVNARQVGTDVAYEKRCIQTIKY